jgi:uncharacterized membrane protein YhhN
LVPFVVLTLVALVGLLVAEFRGSVVGRWIAKPIASTGFVLAAWAGGALETQYGRWVFGALVLGWIGDVLLIPKNSMSFLAGLGAFLVGHLAFALAFAIRGIDPFLMGAAMLVLLGPAFGALRWLGPHVPEEMAVAVRAYVAVITLMVGAAAGGLMKPGGAFVLAGALMFFFSDLAVARERFIENTPVNKLWGLPLYYGAQLLLAWTARAGATH